MDIAAMSMAMSSGKAEYSANVAIIKQIMNFEEATGAALANMARTSAPPYARFLDTRA